MPSALLHNIKHNKVLHERVVILTVAIIAAIALTLRRRPGTRHQDPAKQVQVRREDRVRIVSMPAEPRREVSP